MVDSTATTVIGESILVKGYLQGDEDLTVLGRIEGEIRLARTLTIGESAVIRAEIAVENAVVSGVVVGNLTATGFVEITSTGRLIGTITSPRLIVQSGARVRADIDVGELSEHAIAPLPARQSADTTALVRTSALRSATSTGNALPPRRATPGLQPVSATAPSAAQSSFGSPRNTESWPATPQLAAVRQVPVAAPVSAKKLKKKVIVKRRG